MNFLTILKSDKEIAWNLLCTLLSRTTSLMKENSLQGFEAIAGYHKNSMYIQLKSLTREQFDNIIDRDADHVFLLLKFLSGALAEMNDELLRRTK